MYALQNNHRRAVIDGDTIQLFRNAGKVREVWHSAWPKVRAKRKSYLAVWAAKWIEQATLADGIKNGEVV